MKRGICILTAFALAAGLAGCQSRAGETRAAAAEGRTLADTEAVQKAREETEAKEAEGTGTAEAGTEETGTAGNPASNGILVALDPGHQAPEVDMSGTEPNAPGSQEMKTQATGGTTGSYSGIGEYELNLDIARMVRDELEARGYEVVMTREDNQTAISNAQRAQLANEAGADIAVRIHANGSENPSASGALALIPSAENPWVGNLYEPSAYLAECILNSYCQATGFANQGIQTNDTMTGINWSRIPVVILEMGFMTNQNDDLRMADPQFRTQMVQGIVNGIEAYFL